MKKIYTHLTLIAAIILAFGSTVYGQTTYTFSYTGAVQNWTVPAGITSVVVSAKGAMGGLNATEYSTICSSTLPDRPGYGACVVCTLSVVGGQVLQVRVGGKGGDASQPGCIAIAGTAGYNGGGAGAVGYGPYAGGGGGGASDIQIPPYGLANRVVVAAGGGGAGGNYYTRVDFERGGDGGTLTGEEGYGNATPGGSGGAFGGGPTTGGAPGSYPGWGTGTAGALGIGGAAGVPSGGGGGGGGYYGGGGGSWGGGGGGSSFTSATLASGVTHTRGCNSTGNGEVTITVTCVTPVAGAVVGPTNLCQGATGTYTNPTGSAGGVWTSSVPGVATIGSTTGIVTAIAPGATIISYSVVRSCGTAIATSFLVVNPTPAPITGNTNICTGSTSVLSSLTAGGTWRSTNTAVATIGSTSGMLTGLTVGTTTISYTMPTGCYTTTVVNVAGISGAHKVCVGSTTPLTASVPGGTWSTSDASLATIGSTGIATGVSMGVVDVVYTLGSGCAALWTLTVNPIAPIAGRDSVCIGSTGYLTNIVGGGTWSSTNLSVATISIDSGLVYGVNPGFTTISYILPTGCNVARSIRIIDLPPAITGTRQVCPGQTITLSNSLGGGTWSSSNPAVATVLLNVGVVTGVYPDTTHINYTIKPGCVVSALVTVNPLPERIQGDSVICPGILDTLTDASPGGLWSTTTPSLGTIDRNGVLTSIQGGTAVINYTLPTGCATSKNIQIYPGPNPSITYDWVTNTFYTDLGYPGYQWYDSIQGLIPGATSPSCAALYTQYYWVVVTDTNGCKGPSNKIHFDVIVIHEVGVKQVSASDLKVYPNPSTGIVNIEAPVKVKAVVTGVEGKILLEQDDAKRIDIGNLANGLYMITLYDESGHSLLVQKLIKQ